MSAQERPSGRIRFHLLSGDSFGERRPGDLVEPHAEKAHVQEQAGKIQSLFRDVNERVAESPNAASKHEPVTVLCECADDACVEQIELAKADYEQVREHPSRFVIKAGHEVPDAEHVVARNDGITVVEKVGDAAAIAVDRYPRGDGVVAP